MTDYGNYLNGQFIHHRIGVEGADFTTEEYNNVKGQFLLKQPKPNKEQFNPDKLGKGGENTNTPNKEKADVTKLTRKDL